MRISKYQPLYILIFAIILIMSCNKQKSNYAVAHNGIVNFVVGQAYIIEEGNKKVLNVSDTISESSVIKTEGKNSIVDIYIGQNVLRVNGDTTVEMKTLFKSEDGSSEKVEAFVKQGSVFSRVVKKLAKDDEFKISTPTVVAAVRGTEFLVEQSDDIAIVSCVEGRVAVKDANTEKEVIIEENEEVQLEKDSDLVKNQIDEDRQRQIDIISNIKDLEAEIKQKYEEQAKEIKEKVDEQKENDKAMVDEQKEQDKENVQNVLDETDKKAEESVEAVDKNIEETKKAVDEQMDSTKPNLDDVAPDIDSSNF